MQLYIGDMTTENLNYVIQQYPKSQNLIICNGLTATENELYEADIITELNLYIKKQLTKGKDISLLPSKLLLKNPHVSILYEECEMETTISNPRITQYTEDITQICYALSQRSQRVESITSGIGRILKYKPNAKLCCFIRHGKTLGNLSRRYIGKTNEPLCKEGIMELKAFQTKERYPKSHLIYVSPLTRCIETAKILFPNQPLLSCNALRECDFGEFENKNYMELQSHPYYQTWVDSNGQLPFPNGEIPALFTKRCLKAFLACINHIPYKTSYISSTPAWTTFVVHGGTIMSILSELTVPKGEYFSFQVENGQGYLCEYDLDKQILTILDCIK